MPLNSTTRFSNRVRDYIKYRPGYPADLLNLLETNCGLDRESVVADIGSGTGILTELFLENGNSVFAVEPNKEMREAAEELLGASSLFHSIPGTAEQTTLQDNSIDLVTAAQAFHWFDAKNCHREFQRILKPGGYAAMIWNDRKTDGAPFLKAYESLLIEYGNDYEEVSMKYADEQDLETLFGGSHYSFASFPNQQLFDLEGLKGRLASSSYAPVAGEKNYEPMQQGLEDIFNRYQQNGTIAFEYDTKVYYGPIGQ